MTDHTRDPLDQAIDQVAARLVSVEHDQAMADRIVARLPNRAARSAWAGALVPQAALATVLLVGVFLWTTREPELVREPVVDVVSAGAEAPALRTPMAPALRTTVTPRSDDSQFVLTPDHERALVPVAAPIALEVAALAASALPEEALVVIAPIVLTELPLSGESISPR